MSLPTLADSVQKLQTALQTKAKNEPATRFYSLWDKVFRYDILAEAYRRCRLNRGAPGVDGESFEDIETAGRDQWLERLQQDLKAKTYQSQPLLRVWIPKANGGERPLSIPCSGRHWYYGAKETTDDYRSIDVRRWKRSGLLRPHQAFGWQWSQHGEVVASIRVRTEPDRVILSYRHRSDGEDWKDESYPVYLDWTDCHLGGQRPWFLCPARGCGRRVATLYGGGIFACRHCYQLAYPSQRESYDDRALRKANRIREKLGWEPGIGNCDGLKPKGMHWRTFERLTAQHVAFAGVFFAGMDRQLNRLRESLDDLV